MKAFLAYCKNRKNAAIWIFALAFLMYFLLGLWNTYSQAFIKCTYFGSDNERVFGDLTNIVYNHYRIKVHPLFLIAAQTITFFLNEIVDDPFIAVILEEAFCGAVSVSFVYVILKFKSVETYTCILFTMIYGASFSMLVFSSVPETFIFAGFGLVSYWYFITVALKYSCPLSRKEIFLLVFFGVISFGMTLTNYVSYIIGMIVLLSCRYDVKNAVKKFLFINVINSIAIAVLCIFQQYIWKDCPLFWTSIIGWVHGEGYEETLYMDWQFTVSKTMIWLKNIFLYPLLSPNLGALEINEKLGCLVFDRYSNCFPKIMLILFYIVIFMCIAAKLINICKIAEKTERKYLFGLFAAFGSNLALHYIYGYMEAFMYTPHFYFLFILLAALSLQDIRNSKVQILAKVFLFFFCIVEVINNFMGFKTMTELASGLIEMTHAPSPSMRGILLIVGVLVFCICWIVVKWKNNDINVCEGTMDRKLDCICRYILGYIVIVFVAGLAIAYGYAV